MCHARCHVKRLGQLTNRLKSRHLIYAYSMSIQYSIYQTNKKKTSIAYHTKTKEEKNLQDKIYGNQERALLEWKIIKIRQSFFFSVRNITMLNQMNFNKFKTTLSRNN